MKVNIEGLLSEMTIEEKVTMLAGSAMWHTAPVERLGIPSLKVSDGPNGARGGGSFVGGLTAACFPVGIALASTWDTELVERVGQALGEEAKTKGAHILLAPTVNIHRSPLNGRNFECYSEDPYLSARMAVAYVTGVQSQNVGTSVKHYVCNDSEFQRNSISSEVGERALREIYLPPFKAAVQEAHTWSVMAAYNKINGVFANENPYTLIEILRNEWGFEGFVVSDWFGTTSTVESLNGGLDLEMPGPSVWRGKKLLKAVRDGQVDEATIEESVHRLLGAILRAGAFDNAEERPEKAVDRPDHRALARQAAAEGIVLLKNEDGILPLSADAVGSLAIIGPNAKVARIMGGGSARVNAHYAVTPFQGVVDRAGDAMEIGFEIGCTNHRLLPLLDPNWLTPAAGEDDGGLTAEYFDGLDLIGEPVWTTRMTTTEQFWVGEFSPLVNAQRFSARFTGVFTPREAGRHTFSLVSAGLSRLYIDGEQVIDNWAQQTPGEAYFGAGSTEVTCQRDMNAGQAYDLRLEFSRTEGMMPLAAIRLGCLPPIASDAMGRAAALAAVSDVALVFVGLSDEWESEGYDRPDMALVGNQVALIEAVAAANKNTVVILNTGSPISMNWLDEVAAVVQAWYPGQECGNAIADVLFGDVDPSGRLPQTFPRRLEDNPAYINYPGENGKVLYGEGIFIGYRYYEKKAIEPLFPFGFGLSYTSFQYSNLRITADEIGPEDELRVSVDVTNTGRRAGNDVVQLYVKDTESSLVRPEKELKGFAKAWLEPGETKTVTMTLDRASLAYYDDLGQQWVAEAGQFEVLVGRSSQDIRTTATFALSASAEFGGPKTSGPELGIGSALHVLLASDEARAVLEKHLPGIADSPQLRMAQAFSLEQMAGFAPDVFTSEVLQAIAGDLAEI
jgi:beta-glucosidase